MKRIRWPFLLLGLLVNPWACATVYVDREARGPVHDGLSWATAFQTVAAGLSAASGGGEVWVASGTYAENRLTPAKNVAFYGGFVGTERKRDERDIRANPTVLDGGGTSVDTVICQAEGIVVDGFAIRHGRYGVFVSGGTATLGHCTVSGAGQFGVGIANSTADLVSNAISGNTKHGVYISFGNATLTNNTIAGNGDRGVNAFFSGTVAMSNNVVAFNAGRGVYNASSTIATFSHNDVYGNTGGDYSGFTPPADQGNIGLDPLFTDWANGDFHLASGSPCIDAGDDGAVAGGSTDLDGQPRIRGTHVDIGACEYAAAGPLPFTLADVAKCLFVYSGTQTGSAEDLSRLNVTGDTALDLRDAARLARKVAGLDANP